MKYALGYSEEVFECEEYDTREDAIREGFAGTESNVIWTGEKHPPTQPEEWWVAEDWLELVSCQDEYSGEHAEDWEESTREQREVLEFEVRLVMAKWLDRYNLRPSFFNVKNVKAHFRSDTPHAATQQEAK